MTWAKYNEGTDRYLHSNYLPIPHLAIGKLKLRHPRLPLEIQNEMVPWEKILTIHR